MSALRAAYVVRSFPRLTQTFVLGEMLGIEALGVDLTVFASVDPQEPVVQPDVARLRAEVVHLEPLRERTGWMASVLRHPARLAATAAFVAGHTAAERGYHAAGRWDLFTDARFIARHLERHGIEHLHAHFAHDPALTAYLVHRLTGIPFSFTAHARDLFEVDPEALGPVAEAARTILTCTGAGASYLRGLGVTTPVEVIYHGVDLERFGPATASDGPLRLLTIGRHVAKKGFPTLLEAVARAAKEADLTLTMVGDGPDRAALEELVDQLGLRSLVTFTGEVDHERVRELFSQADAFALAPVTTDTGDRDGIPNVMVEAMACGLPVVSTDAGAVAELVVEGHNGRLLKVGDVGGFAQALIDLSALERRRDLGRNARATVSEHFDVRQGAKRVLDVLVGAS